jgi:hypothetical protein
MLSPSDPMNESLGNKEETTNRSAEERKSTENHKKVAGYLKNHRENLQHLPQFP